MGKLSNWSRLLYVYFPKTGRRLVKRRWTLSIELMSLSEVTKQ